MISMMEMDRDELLNLLPEYDKRGEWYIHEDSAAIHIRQRVGSGYSSVSVWCLDRRVAEFICRVRNELVGTAE